MNIKELIEEAHSCAKTKGWHDKKKSFGDDISLIHSELSEALEAYREGHSPEKLYFGVNGKPEGVPSELADVLIRIFDMAGKYGIDLEGALNCKMEYNRTRLYRHGGKTL